MDNAVDVLQALVIGFLVARFLLNSTHVLTAVELFREFLILLNHKALKNETGLAIAEIKERIHYGLFQGYCLINDYLRAIEYGREVLVSARRRGNRDIEGSVTFTLAKLHHYKGIYQEAKELYSKALSFMVDTGEKALELNCYGNMGTLHWSMGKYSEAKEYLVKALAITIEIGDRSEESWCYSLLGKLVHLLGEYAIAEKYQEKALAITKEIGDRKNEGLCYINLGTVFQSLGKYTTAKEHLLNAIEIAKEVGDRENEASCLANLGTLFHSVGDYSKAKEHLKIAIAITVEIGDKKNGALYHGKLGRVFVSTFEYAKAKECHETALAIAKELGDKESEPAFYTNLGMALDAMGEYVNAEEYYEKALAVTKEIGDRRNEASCNVNLGNLCRSVCQYAKAKIYYEKALEIAKEIGHRENEILCYRNLGTVLQPVGEFAKAIEYHEQALAIAKETGDTNIETMQYVELGKLFESWGDYVRARDYHEKALAISKDIGDKESEVLCHFGLGTVYYSFGKFAKSKECLEKAIAIARAIGDKRREAQCYGVLGALLESLGEYSQSKTYLEESLKVTETIGDWELKGACYQNLGTLFHSMGKCVKAKDYHENALAITKEIGNRKEEASCLRCLGVVFYTLGEHAKAEEYHEKSLVITKEICDKRGEAESYGNLGIVCHSLGEYARAKEYHEKALEISKNIGDIKNEFTTQQNLATLMLLEGKVREAQSYLLASIDAFQKMGMFLTDNDQLKISLLEKHVIIYQILSYLFCRTKNPEQALCVTELGRARALADLMSSQYSVQKQISDNPETWVGIGAIMKNERNCACLYISYFENEIHFWILKADTPTHFQYVDVNDFFMGEAKREVDEVLGSKIFRRVHALPPDQCEDRCWVPSKDNRTKGTKPTQEKGCGSWRLTEEDEDVNQILELTLADCYKMIVAPVAELLKESEIIIVPDRSLFKVPFAALEDERGKFLSESCRIRIVPSLTTLKLIHDSPSDYHSQTGALIVGDPEVGEVLYNGCLTRKPPLHFAREEAEMIGRLIGVHPLLGKQATKQAVLESINSVSLIHFAAHGNAERGEIVLAPARTTKTTPEEEDYLLTMADISQVRLRAKLVVLSCCHSANGEIRAEGVVGIARAFLGSGARSVLVALWAIEDEATKQFMSRFYEHLVRGESASESLHQAMKWMREKGFSEVEQWAPFMLIGDNVSFEFGNKTQKIACAGGKS